MSEPRGVVLIGEGEPLQGIRYGGGGAIRTHSTVLGSTSGTIRLVGSEHQLTKLAASAPVDFSGAH